MTGITQVQVDLAPTLGEALSLFQGWLSRHGLIGEATKEDDLVLESMSEIHELQGGVNFVEDVDVDEEENSKNEEEEDDEEEEEDDDEDDGEDLSVLNESHEDEEGNLGFASEGSPLSRTASARSFAICTDGPWDLRNFLAAEVARKGGAVLESHRRAPYLHTWVNLRWLHSAFYDRPRMGIAATLQHHGLVFEGRQHRYNSDPTAVIFVDERFADALLCLCTVRLEPLPLCSGLDDTRNIARIAARMLADGCSMPVNDGLAEGLGSAAPRGGARGKGGKSKGRAPGAKGQSRKQRTAAAQARAKLIKSQAAQALKPTKT